MTLHGRVLKYGANINTDLISPAPYVGLAKEITVAHAMQGVDPDFPQKVQPGDFIVAGPNFGSGSSRESAPLVLKDSQVGAVLSPLFARIFYRNAINIGLPVLIFQEIDQLQDGDELEIDPIAGIVRNLTTDATFTCAKLPENLMQLVQDGGLIAHIEKQLANS
ncbi:MAG: 3-isopropylmalate dehydratase [Anaerotruncus sp.]|nr:3-isopropylmalate dehydratase [Anaerotruncus sp.]